MSKVSDRDRLINEVLLQGYIYAISDVKDDGTRVIERTKVYALTTKCVYPGEIVSYFETDIGDFCIDEYTVWWWVKKPEKDDVETPEDVLELSQAIINSGVDVGYVDRLYWKEKDSAVKQLAKYIIEQGWHK